MVRNLVLAGCGLILLMGCSAAGNKFAQGPISMNSHSPSSITSSSLVTLAEGQDLQQLVAGSSGPVLIDFYADWCGPCRKQSEILHQFEPAVNQSAASIIKVNVDQHPALAEQFEVSSLPTLMVVKDGQILQRHNGIASQQKLAQLLSH